MVPTAGEHFGPYEILGTLGRGGVGEVYRAWDGRLEREVALKVLHDEYPQQGNRERFMIEARAASALNHANICTVFDIGHKQGAPYLVMELLKGETLKQRIERGGIPSEEIAQFGAEIAQALGAAHALGIVHRDIKPANVMLVRQPDGTSRVKVLDFGLAKLTGPLPGRLSHHDEHLTVLGEAVGTVSYMSPEQARGEELDGRSDLFSLGVVLYEMATRRTPFHGSTTALLFVQLLSHAPEPIQNWNESVPRALEKVILRLLEKDPARRFQSAADVAVALLSVATKNSGSRWRKASSPAVPLVRVEEPIARPGLPARPDFRHEQGVITLGLNSNSHLREPHITTPEPESTAEPLSGSLHPAAPLPAINPPRSRTPSTIRQSSIHRKDSAIRQASSFSKDGSYRRDSTIRQISTQFTRRDSALHLPRTSGLHAISVETPVGSLPVAVDPPETDPAPSRYANRPSPHSGHFPHIAASADHDDTGASQLPRKQPLLRAGVAAAVVLLLVAIFGATRLLHRSAALLSPSDSILITEIENHTGVQTLDGSVAAGLDLALSQAPEFDVRGVAAYRASVHTMGADDRPASAMQARQAAHAAGARAFLYGEVREAEEGAHSTAAGYTLSAAVIETATSRELVRAEARAARIQEIPGAIDEVASSLRSQLLGHPLAKPRTTSTSSTTGVPLAREASGNLNALRAFAAGVRAEGENRPDAALRAYATAASADPNFVQALVRISWLARSQAADSSSARAAARAQAAVSGRSPRTIELAGIAAAANATGDLAQAEAAARRLIAARPHAPESLLELARILRLEGHLPEALTAAQQGLAASPHHAGLFREAELSLLALDRYDEALALEDNASALGLAHPGLALASTYLAGRRDRLPDAVNAFATPTDPESLALRATFLDNTGQLSASIAAWREAGDSTRGQTSLTGSATVFTAHAALDRALAGDCPSAIAIGRSAATASTTTPDSQFHAGLAGALCADTALARSTLASLTGPQAAAFQIPALRAATALGQGDPDAALRELASIQQYDPTLLTRYLRGLAHLAAHDTQSAAADLQNVLTHRGAALTGGTSVYPAAELALSRALTAQGDLAGSQQALARFHQLWNAASPEAVHRAQEPLPSPAASASADFTSASFASAGPRTRVRPDLAEPIRKQTYAQEKAALTAWPDRPARLPSYPQERRYQNIRESDLE